MKKVLLSVFVVLMMLSCGEKMSVEKINELESKVFAKNATLTAENVIQLVDAYVLFAEQNPNDQQTPDFLFKALDVAVGVNAEGPQKAIDIANVLIEKYPDFEMTPMAMFIKGFVYENMIGDLQNAEVTYRQFIEKYPNNSMVEDVKSTLENLGLTPEELIRKFEEAN
ncbi:MAG: tetratricopeptide repeat protein [Bacteroidales bacterium]|nr:tetratricopeptide repeat protein [Bacteroidales bacterium]